MEDADGHAHARAYICTHTTPRCPLTACSATRTLCSASASCVSLPAATTWHRRPMPRRVCCVSGHVAAWSRIVSYFSAGDMSKRCHRPET